MVLEMKASSEEHAPYKSIIRLQMGLNTCETFRPLLVRN